MIVIPGQLSLGLLPHYCLMSKLYRIVTCFPVSVFAYCQQMSFSFCLGDFHVYTKHCFARCMTLHGQGELGFFCLPLHLPLGYGRFCCIVLYYMIQQFMHPLDSYLCFFFLHVGSGSFALSCGLFWVTIFNKTN